MAVAFDAASGVTDADNGSGVLTQAHTVSGANRLLMVAVAARITGGFTTTGVTYNGTALTKLSGLTGNTRAQLDVWYLIAPATGTHNVVVTRGGVDQVGIGVVSFTGVDQTTPLGTAVTGGINNGTAGGATTQSVTVTSATGNMTFDACAWGDDTSGTLSTNQTQRVNGHNWFLGSQTGASILGMASAAGSASNTHTWTESPNTGDYTAQIGVNVIAAASGTAYTLTAAEGTYSVTGQAATFTYTAAGTTYTLTAAQGTYGVTGSDANVDSSFAAVQGTYSTTGFAATFTYGYEGQLIEGTYGITTQWFPVGLIWSGAASGQVRFPRRGTNGSRKPKPYRYKFFAR